MSVSIAVLDDFQEVARDFGDWQRLADRAEISFFHDHLRDEDALAERLAPFAAIGLMRERTPFPRTLIDRLPNLRCLVTTGMVNRAIDLAAASERDIIVCGSQTSGGGTVQLTFALMLALMQAIPHVDRDIRAGRWQTGVGDELSGKTLGIVGLGRIGTKVAAIARAFDMHTIAWSANMTADAAAAAGCELVAKDQLLGRADVITVHLVLGERSRGLFGEREFARMKPSAYFINTSRGPIADEGALLAALREGRIAGAGLDVFAVEPLPVDHPFRSAPNTVLTPHIGYVSKQSYATFYGQMVEDFEAWLSGEPLRRLA